jgi:hypothetical protein
VPGRLYDATVDIAKKQVIGFYELPTGVSIVVSCPLSDAEFAASQAYPETFFGEIRQPTRRAETLVDLCDFFASPTKTRRAISSSNGCPGRQI